MFFPTMLEKEEVYLNHKNQSIIMVPEPDVFGLPGSEETLLSLFPGAVLPVPAVCACSIEGSANPPLLDCLSRVDPEL